MRAPTNWRSPGPAAAPPIMWAGASPIRRPDLPPHPTDVVHQPVDLGGQLHIAFDADGGLVAAQAVLASASGSSVTSSSRSGWRLRAPVEQAGRRDQQRHRNGATARAPHALLAHQALHGLFSCISTWLRKSTTRCCIAPAIGAAARFHHAFDQAVEKEKGDCVAIVPDYS
jgi:hypothetical protein